MSMRVLITGSSGLIGSGLKRVLAERGDEPIPLVRGDSHPGGRTWNPAEGRIDDAALEGVDAVVHLAGRPINPPFTRRRKEEIRRSRVDGTALVAREVARHRPRVFVSASAVGFYGSRGEEELVEDSGPGSGFLAEVVRAWEEATRPAEAAGVRTVKVRTGLVLAGRGGLLPRVMLPFKLGLGGPLGDGRQWWSWISLADHLRALLACIDDERFSGPVNLTAPHPVRNADFARRLAERLRRPAALRVPAWALRMAVGREAADELLLASQRVLPKRLADGGFDFRHPTLEEALAWALDQEPR